MQAVKAPVALFIQAPPADRQHGQPGQDAHDNNHQPAHLGQALRDKLILTLEHIEERCPEARLPAQPHQFAFHQAPCRPSVEQHACRQATGDPSHPAPAKVAVDPEAVEDTEDHQRPENDQRGEFGGKNTVTEGEQEPGPDCGVIQEAQQQPCEDEEEQEVEQGDMEARGGVPDGHCAHERQCRGCSRKERSAVGRLCVEIGDRHGPPHGIRRDAEDHPHDAGAAQGAEEIEAEDHLPRRQCGGQGHQPAP